MFRAEKKDRRWDGEGCDGILVAIERGEQHLGSCAVEKRHLRKYQMTQIASDFDGQERGEVVEVVGREERRPMSRF